MVPLEPPCLETRLAALATWAKNEAVELPEPIARLIAESFEGSFAVLKERWAVIARLSAETGSPVSREVVLRAAGSNPIRVPLPAIINVVARRFELPASVILGRQRSRPARFAREISVYLSRSLTGFPWPRSDLPAATCAMKRRCWPPSPFPSERPRIPTSVTFLTS